MIVTGVHWAHNPIAVGRAFMMKTIACWYTNAQMVIFGMVQNAWKILSAKYAWTGRTTTEWHV